MRMKPNMLTSMGHLALLIGVLFCHLQTLVSAQTSAYAMWFQPGVQVTRVNSPKCPVRMYLTN